MEHVKRAAIQQLRGYFHEQKEWGTRSRGICFGAGMCRNWNLCITKCFYEYICTLYKWGASLHQFVDFLNTVSEKSYDYLFQKNYAGENCSWKVRLLPVRQPTFQVETKTKLDNEILRYPISNSINTVETQVGITSRKQPPLLSDQFSKIPKVC